MVSKTTEWGSSPHSLAKIRKKNQMKKYLVEVKPAEGGKDSELFVDDLINAYQKTFDKLG